MSRKNKKTSLTSAFVRIGNRLLQKAQGKRHRMLTKDSPCVRVAYAYADHLHEEGAVATRAEIKLRSGVSDDDELAGGTHIWNTFVEETCDEMGIPKDGG